MLDGCAYDDWKVYFSFGLEDMNNMTSEFQLEGIRVDPRRYVLPIDPALQVKALLDH